METTKLSSKGQIILPKALRQVRNWQSGTRFSIENVEDGVLLKPLQPFEPTRIEDALGCLKKPSKPHSITEMHKAIAANLRRRRASGRY
jgi:AbrB family looped-hinge helix DNA binding protein